MAELKDIKIGEMVIQKMNKLRRLIKAGEDGEVTKGFSIQFDECKNSLEGALVSEYKILVKNDHGEILNEDLLNSPGKNTIKNDDTTKIRWRGSVDDTNVLGSFNNNANDQEDDDNI